jgi:hypothetical protein
LRVIGFLSGLFVADVQYSRIVGIVIRLAVTRDSDGRAKFVRTGSFCLGDALERYGESRRSAIVQLSPPRVVGQGGPACNDHERHTDQYDWKSDMAAIGARSTMACWDGIPHLGDALDNSRDTASDESKKLV